MERNTVPPATGEQQPGSVPLPMEPRESGTILRVPPASAGAVVMVVDDERSIRDLLRRLLERAGYRVLTAAHGGEALQRFTEESGAVDLVITDVRMPEMTGPELADHLTALRPDLRILYISGYSAPLIAHQAAARAVFLQKPFTSATLLARIGEMLDGRD